MDNDNAIQPARDDDNNNDDDDAQWQNTPGEPILGRGQQRWWPNPRIHGGKWINYVKTKETYYISQKFKCGGLNWQFLANMKWDDTISNILKEKDKLHGTFEWMDPGIIGKSKLGRQSRLMYCNEWRISRWLLGSCKERDTNSLQQGCLGMSGRNQQHEHIAKHLGFQMQTISQHIG